MEQEMTSNPSSHQIQDSLISEKLSADLESALADFFYYFLYSINK